MRHTYHTNVRIIFYHWPLFVIDLTLARWNIFKSSLTSVTDQNERQNKILVTMYKTQKKNLTIKRENMINLCVVQKTYDFAAIALSCMQNLISTSYH